MDELRISTFHAEVTRLADDALWYAWGRIDSGAPAVSRMDSDTAFAFRDWYRELARQYAAGETYFRPSLMGEWERWSTAGRVILH